MWGSKKKRKPAEVDTLIGHKSELHGNVMFDGGLHVEGTIKGNVTADEGNTAILVVGEHGCVEGEVRVPHVVISGIVMGDVHAAESVELSPHARVTGNIYYNRLEMAMGAEINGQLIHLAETELKQLPSVKSVKEG